MLVKGRWIYDSAHEGWNEIYPVTYAQRIGRYDIRVMPHDLPGYWFGRLKEWRKQLNPGKFQEAIKARPELCRCPCCAGTDVPLFRPAGRGNRAGRTLAHRPMMG
jgi:hypothetical protein